MNSRERVFATAAGQPVDRPAHYLNLSMYGARMTRCPLRQYYTCASEYADGQSAVQEAFGPDLHLSPFLFNALGEAFGSTVHYLEDQAPSLAAPGAPTAEAFLGRPFPDPDSHPRLRYLRETVRLMKQRFRDEIPVVGVLPSPAELPALVMGLGAWLEVLLLDDASARRILERCTDFCIRFGNALHADGASLLAMTASFCTRSVIPERLIAELTLPALADTLKGFHAPGIVHHGGCPVAPHLEAFRALPHVAAFVIDARDSLPGARAALGPAPILAGGLDSTTLHLRTPEEIRRRCCEVLEERSQDPRFLLTGSGPDVSLSASPEQVRAVREQVQAHRPVLS